MTMARAAEMLLRRKITTTLTVRQPERLVKASFFGATSYRYWLIKPAFPAAKRLDAIHRVGDFAIIEQADDLFYQNDPPILSKWIY